MKRESCIAAALLCAAVLGPVRGWTATRRTVCTISFNGSDEVDAFRAFLPPDEFEFVDLAPDATPGGDSRRTWLLDACRPDVQCDVVIYAGEFAGRFFGTRPFALAVQEME